MRIIALRTLRDFWKRHADAEQPLKAWFAIARRADWASPADIKREFAHASVVDAERIVFNIGGNKYRLAVKVWFRKRAMWIKFVGTHREYDKIDVTGL